MPPGVYAHKSRSVAERFWEKVFIGSFSNADVCWLWTASKSRLGYGYFRWPGHTKIAPRVAYELVFGPFPKHLTVCHRCDNPACVRPQHLFLGTQQDNLADMKRKQRHAFGERIASSKLTEADVRAIKVSTGPHRDIAKQYGIHEDHVGRLKAGRRWAHIN